MYPCWNATTLPSTTGSMQLVALHVSSCLSVTVNAKAQSSSSSQRDTFLPPTKLAACRRLPESRRWLLLPFVTLSLCPVQIQNQNDHSFHILHISFLFPLAGQLSFLEKLPSLPQLKSFQPLSFSWPCSILIALTSSSSVLCIFVFMLVSF